MNRPNQHHTRLTIVFRFALIVILIMGLWSCEDEENPVEPVDKPLPGAYEISLKVDSMTRWFKLVIPPHYDHSEARPSFSSFHADNLPMALVLANRKQKHGSSTEISSG